MWGKNTFTTRYGSLSDRTHPHRAILFPMAGPHRLAILALAALISILAGCENDQGGEAGQSDDHAAITRTAENGPVRLSLSLSHSHVELAEPVQVRLEIIADSTVTVTEPGYVDTLRDGDRAFEYRVHPGRRERAVPSGGGQLRWTYEYEIEFVLPGEFELPPAEVSFVRLRDLDAEEASVPETVSTEPITLMVTVPPGAELSDEEMRTVSRLDPIDLPRVWPWPSWLAAGGVVVLILALLRYLWNRRRRRGTTIVPIPADVWARQQISALLEDDLLSGGRAQEFHYRISEIVRGYTERRFAVSAPEMTTEEFLSTAASDNRFGPEITDELERFLAACDMVKYARHEPGTDECDAVLRATRDFIERTRERVSQKDSPTTATRSAEERAA